MGDVAPAQVVGDPLGHLLAQLGEVVVGQPPVQHTLRVVHLAVPHEMDDGDVVVR